MPLSLLPVLVPLAVAVAAAVAMTQDSAPPATPPPAEAPATAAAADVLLASDGKEAKPGRLPGGVTEDAVKLWRGLEGALGGAAAPPPGKEDAPRSFELLLDVRLKRDSGTNDFRARFAYLDAGPGLVKGTLYKPRKDEVLSIQMRGLKDEASGRLGYWYRKVSGGGTTDGFVELRGSDFRTDREEVDQWAAASYDIARLIEPTSMRIVDLTALQPSGETRFDAGFIQLGDDPGFMLPRVDVLGVVDGKSQSLGELARNLVWLQLSTPDFRLFSTGTTRAQREAQRKAVKRVVFGLHKDTLRPNLVIVAPSREGPLQAPGSVLVQCTEWFKDRAGAPAGGEAPMLPGRFFAYEVLRNMRSGALLFSDSASADLFLLDGSRLHADLKPEDFLPPEK